VRAAPGEAARREGVTVLGSWEAEGVTLGQVESALSDLRRHEQRAAVRTSVLTLVVVVDDHDAAQAALGVVHDLGGRHPSRTLVVVIGRDSPDGRSGVDASACVQAVEHETRSMCFEEVVLDVRGRARHHLDSVVEPLTLPDLPVVVWLPSGLPSPGDPLLASADRIVVDTRAVGEDQGVLNRVAVLARRLPVTDLSWMRLAPWRGLLAGLFEGSVFRPFLGSVQEVEVAGNFGPRHLLGGWLMRRLRLPPTHVSATPAEHASIRLTASHEGRLGRFAVERRSEERVIHSLVDIQGGPSVAQTLHMREQWPSLALADAMRTVGRDERYEEALGGALDLLGVMTGSRRARVGGP
jgi:glucose-6-phosphate dehydrogenase assembly protein OpcA